MTDKRIIWEALMYLVPSSHPAIYNYIEGGSRSKESAMMKAVGAVYPLFRGAYDVSMIRKEARTYLEVMAEDYRKGKFEIKSIYST
jgi:hypothetical protein